MLALHIGHRPAWPVCLACCLCPDTSLVSQPWLKVQPCFISFQNEPKGQEAAQEKSEEQAPESGEIYQQGPLQVPNPNPPRSRASLSSCIPGAPETSWGQKLELGSDSPHRDSLSSAALCHVLGAFSCPWPPCRGQRWEPQVGPGEGNLYKTSKGSDQ